MALPWISLTTVEALETALETTGKKLFFKHSTRCIISSMALKSFEREWDTALDVTLYFIDLIANRPVSNELAEISQVQHQSPQAIVMDGTKVLHSSSHEQIDANKIKQLLKS
jgi:bacillithiol system protein YtxJ